MFNASFKAWRYGPVDKEIYDLFKNKQLDLRGNVDAFSNSTISYMNDVKQYLDELLDKIFKTSDFGLVDMSREDNSWKKAIETKDKIIPNEEIINDYLVKY